MLMTVTELKKYITTTEEDTVLEAKLQALELLIRKYTNNNFQARAYRCKADIVDGSFIVKALPFNEEDTIQVSESPLNEGLYTIETVNGSTFTVKEPVADESGVLVTKIHYPMDIKMGIVNLMKWEMENRDKVGIQSETISRHSVTYFNMDGDNSIMGYPKSLMGFLRPYMKARF